MESNPRRHPIHELGSHLAIGVVVIGLLAVASWVRGYELLIYGWFMIIGIAILLRLRRRRRTFVVLWSLLMFVAARGLIWVAEQRLEVVNASGQALPRVEVRIGDLMDGQDPIVIENVAAGAIWSHSFRWFAYDGHAGVRTWFPDGRTTWDYTARGRYRGYHGRQRLIIQPDGRIITEIM